MNGRRAVIGLCMLCALLVSAFAAQSASAVTNGTTAFTCKNTGISGPGFTKAHCKAADAGTGNFSHVAINQDTTTEIELTSKKTNATTDNCETSIFKSTIGGLGTELKSCDIHGTGWMENKVEGSEHYTVGHVTLTFTGVTVSGPPGCEVVTDNADKSQGETGVVHTEPLRITSKGQGDALKIEPTTGTTIARFHFKNCNTGGLNLTYTVSGSLICKPDGATVNCTHADVTTQNTLKLNGVTKAGQNGPLTVLGKAKTDPAGSFTPLSNTTVGT